MEPWRQTRSVSAPPPAADAPDPLLGTLVGGRWRLERVLGEGGHARVYAGRDETGVTVAVKVLHAHLLADKLLCERFRREAEHAASVAHRRIVRTLGVGELDDGRPFIAMERLEGTPLDALIARGPLPLAAVLSIGEQMAEALARAHDLGLVHRDIKPANVFVTAGEGEAPEVKLVDFGLARRVQEEPSTRKLTRRGEIIGTPAYIAPEILRGAPAGPSIDLYALGCVLFEMLGGRPPFVGATVPQVLLMQLEDEAPDVRTLRADTPSALAELVRALLDKQPDARPPDAHQVQRALGELLEALDARPSLAGIAAMRPAAEAEVALDPWRRSLRDLVLRVPPGDAGARALASKVSSDLAALEREEAVGAELRARIRALDDATYEARERLGHAVQEIGVELSEARVAQRASQAALEAAREADRDAESALRRDERDMTMHWPARFDHPSRSLADRVEKTALAMRAWCDARDALDRARAAIAPCDARVEDLEFQLDALRGRLREREVQATLEQSEPGTLLALVQDRVQTIEERLRAEVEALSARVG